MVPKMSIHESTSEIYYTIYNFLLIRSTYYDLENNLSNTYLPNVPKKIIVL